MQDRPGGSGPSLAGAATDDDPKPKYGLCVTGLVHPDRIYRNSSVCPGGTRRNLDYYAPNIRWHSRIEEHDRLLLADAQTSGGLLISVPASRATALVHALAQRGVATRAVIGEIVAGPPGSIHVLPG